MLPTNVYSFMKKMVSNTENLNANQFVTPSNSTSTAGAMGRLRQTLQQAQESVSNRLQASKAQPATNTEFQQQLEAQQIVLQTSTPTIECKEITEAAHLPPYNFIGLAHNRCNLAAQVKIEFPVFIHNFGARPGSFGRCRVCVKAMKPDEYFRECTECSLRVCDDCASYSNNAEGNETSWRCSVCRRRGVAIIARRVQPGIEQSEALEGVGFETTVRKSPDSRRLQAGGRADSENEVLLLAPKPSDVRRHSDVPLRDIAKFQAQTISSATSQNDLGPSLNVGTDKTKARSSTELMQKDNPSIIIPKDIIISKPNSEKKGGGEVRTSPKSGPVKRQRSYERGASEGALNIPGNNRGRRASCDLRSIDPSALNLNNNSVPSSQPDPGSEKHDSGKPEYQSSISRNTGSQNVHQHQHQQPQQQESLGQSGIGGGVKNVTSGSTESSNLIIRNDTRRRSVQIYNSGTKVAATPRSCTSLDTSEGPVDLKNSTEPPAIKRQGSSTDGEAIKIVIDDVDSTSAKDNNKTTDVSEMRTRVVRLRRDAQDRGYQTRGFGIRVVGGCTTAHGNPGYLRARVARVAPGSGADFAGIRRGDVVLSWNGVKLTNLTFEETCKVMDASGDTVELNIASLDNDQILISTTVPEDDNNTEWEENNDSESLGVNTGGERADRSSPASPTHIRRLPRLPGEGRIQLRLFHDEIHNTLEIAVVNIAFGQDDSSTLDLNDIVITLRIGEKIANTRWNQCTLFTKMKPEDLFDSWLIMELVRGSDFIGECHVDMGRVSLDDRPVWFPFSSKGSSSHRGSISVILNNPAGNTTPSARELARRLRMRGLAAGSQSQSEDQDDSSGQSSPCASSLLRPEVAWEVLGTLGPPGVMLTCRSAPTSRRGSAQSDRGVIDENQDGRGSLPSTPQMPRSLPPSRRGSFAVAVEEVINRSRRSSIVQPRFPDTLGRLLPEIPDSDRPDPSMLRNRRSSAWNPRDIGFDRRTQFERTDSLHTINPARRTSADFREFGPDTRNRQPPRKSGETDESWRQPAPQWAPRE